MKFCVSILFEKEIHNSISTFLSISKNNKLNIKHAISRSGERQNPQPSNYFRTRPQDSQSNNTHLLIVNSS